MGLTKINETKVVLDIIKNGQLKIGKEMIDISEDLRKYSSIEYRKIDIDKINVNKVEKLESPCKVYIIPCGSGDVAFEPEFDNEKVCILNFASSKHPGGGFMTGAHAQEENLCYHSNLYDALCKHEKFYEYNNKNLNKSLYTDGIIYTADVLFFRKRFNNIVPKLVDVITCAAPNKGAALRSGVKSVEIDNTMTRRLEQILKVAIENGAKTLVLGAFGCGVFKNDIEYVAQETKKLLFTKGYAMYFENIIIPGMSKTDRVYKSFSRIFKGVPNLIIKIE